MPKLRYRYYASDQLKKDNKKEKIEESKRKHLAKQRKAQAKLDMLSQSVPSQQITSSSTSSSSSSINTIENLSQLLTNSWTPPTPHAITHQTSSSYMLSDSKRGVITISDDDSADE